MRANGRGRSRFLPVSTHIIKLHFSNIRAKNSMKGDNLMSVKEMYLGELISKSILNKIAVSSKYRTDFLGRNLFFKHCGLFILIEV